MCMACLHLCMCIEVCCMHACVYVCASICMYKCVCVHVCVYVHDIGGLRLMLGVFLSHCICRVSCFTRGS